MSENTKLDPATLTATVQEVFPPPPALAGWLAFYYDSGGVIADDRGWYCTGKAHATREEALCDLSAFRPFEGSALVKVGQASALFAPAPEKAVCPNCKRDDTGHSWKVNGELRYSCNGWNKPAQPEPATEKAECLNCEQPTDESPDRPLFSDHLCQKPEPAAPRCNGADTHDFFHGNCRICGLNVNPHRKPPESSEGGVDSNKPEPAAQGKPKVELPKVREFLERKGWSCEQAQARLDALAELDAAEGRKP